MTDQFPAFFDPAMIAGLQTMAKIDPATLTPEQREAVARAILATERVIGTMAGTMQAVNDGGEGDEK
jgi:hypothetical protein